MFRISLLVISCLPLLFSCTTDSKAVAENEQAYQDYRAFVTAIESDTTLLETDLGSAWQLRTDSLMQKADTHRQHIDAYLDSYPAERREEVNAFNERLEAAFETRQNRFDELSYRYELREKLLGLKIQEDDMSMIDSTNIVLTFAHFTNTLKVNADNYTTKDWDLIEGWWSALTNRAKAVTGSLAPSEQEKIAVYQERYRQLKEQAAELLSIRASSESLEQSSNSISTP